MSTDTATWLRSLPVLTGAGVVSLNSAWSPDPGSQFLTWLEHAVEGGVAEPHVAVLSTVDADGVPDARALILKDVDDRGWAFAGPAASAKGAQLRAEPVAALTFWWQPIARSVRVRGRVVDATAEESASDLAARPSTARKGITAGEWRLWRLRPNRVEFWQGEPDRRHNRILYTSVPGDRWAVSGTRGTEPIALNIS